MTTKSAVARQYLAEKVRDEMDEKGTVDDEAGKASGRASEASDSDGRGENTLDDDMILDKYSEYWYEPDGKYTYAVRPPERLSDKDQRYYKTKDGAVKRILQWHADS